MEETTAGREEGGERGRKGGGMISVHCARVTRVRGREEEGQRVVYRPKTTQVDRHGSSSHRPGPSLTETMPIHLSHTSQRF